MIQPAKPQPTPESSDAPPRVVSRARAVRLARPLSLCLCDFDPLYAHAVASWVRDEKELLWLAPRTLSPLSAPKVMAWQRPGGNRMLLWDASSATPIGYGELNEMPNEPGHLWIGHFVIAPHFRGRGLGRRFVHALLCRGFQDLGARLVSLVVFPENQFAIRCYEQNALQATGREIKYVKESRMRHEFVRMAISLPQFERLIGCGELPLRSILYIDDGAMLRRGPVRLPTISG
ncbi:MAG TPA: GNAT family N-acetyltransferase [Phycisphaerae bacterium]|nr:GNAT family N-acetyltransferase [Phycisphaerae bacterium]